MQVSEGTAYYQAEHRRYRRLEVSLPVWLTTEEELHNAGRTEWSLGYTRDISVGGTKIVVPPGEEAKWREVSQRNGTCVMRFDVPGKDEMEFITGRIRRAEHD